MGPHLLQPRASERSEEAELEYSLPRHFMGIWKSSPLQTKPRCQRLSNLPFIAWGRRAARWGEGEKWLCHLAAAFSEHLLHPNGDAQEPALPSDLLPGQRQTGLPWERVALILSFKAKMENVSELRQRDSIVEGEFSPMQTQLEG